jgi:divalent metal cation (Fe/Co/Zn/Cd) transporter
MVGAILMLLGVSIVLYCAWMKKLRDVPLRYGVAALVCGGMSLFLFAVVFALVRQAYRVAANPAWVMAALIALAAAVGAFLALLAWGALSDPKSLLGSRFREKSADAAQYFLLNAAFESLMWVGFGLVIWAGSYSIYLGVVVFLCLVLLLLLIMRRQLKNDIEALDDPNDNPRANRLIGKSREPGSYHYRDYDGQE